MLKTRVIPLLLLKDGLLKKPLRFVERPRTVANALSIARVFEARQVDELVLLDISGADSRGQTKNVNPVIVQQIADELTVPFTVGGGVRSTDMIGRLIAAGAEKVTLNTGAIDRPDLIREAAIRFGSQCVVVSIDIKRQPDGRLEVYAENGRRPTGLDPVLWAREAVALGAGELLVNAIDHDGTMAGYDILVIRAVADAVTVPVIAAGGAGEPEHFVRAVKEGHAAAAAAGSIFFFRRTTPLMVKEAMADAGIPVRIEAHQPRLTVTESALGQGDAEQRY
jgi:cyclase